MRKNHPCIRWALVLLCGLVGSVTRTAVAQRATPPRGFRADYDVAYVPGGEPAQTLDVYYPEQAPDKPLPLLVWVHGGGWKAGSKDENPYMRHLTRGYVTASIEYRFSQQAKFPAQIQDCQAAIRWLRANASRYRIDPARIGVGGASAGGHLAALLGTSGGQGRFPKIGGHHEQSDRVQAVCDIFGPTDFWTVVSQAEEDKAVRNIFAWNESDPYSMLIGARLGVDREACDAVSPVTYVVGDNPPFLILHGDRDELVPYAQSVELADRLEKAGVAVTLQRIPGAGHGGPAFSTPKLGALTEAFFDKHLQGRDVEIHPIAASDFPTPANGSTGEPRSVR
jgi:acetyl esterase/lipase